MRKGIVILALPVWDGSAQTANPRQQPGATMTMFAPEQQHDLYYGQYILSATASTWWAA